jgi:hypothetical protein
MKKFLSILLFLSCWHVNAQGTLYGNHVIEPYLGFPNISRYVPSIFYLTETIDVTKYRGMAPSGLRYSYMLRDELSVGVDVMYNFSNQTYNSTDTVFQNGQWSYIPSTGLRQERRLRIHARMNFHLPTLIPEADSYIGIGIGTNNRWLRNSKNGNLESLVKGDDAVLLPFSMRICYGFRYYFTYNLGINLEVGVGGPLLSAGLSYKI